MVTTPFKIAFLLILLAGASTALNAFADKVVLKNGTVEESTRVWETDRYVHFILKGTRSVEIRYAKEIVDHIEDVDGAIRSVSSKKPDMSPQLPPDSPTPLPAIVAEKTDASDQGKPIRLERDFIERNRKLAFYDPRRPQRYWADRQSQHHSYAAAMAALAAQYDHSVDWIEKNMGQENDLGTIHASLIAAVEAEAAQNSSTPLKAEATPAPAENQNTHEAQVPYPAPNPAHAMIREGAQSPVPAIPPGIPFYDPRRPQKYWVSPKDHCASLQEAIQFLAKIYDVPVAYIESNLGESNDLSQIHASIQKSLGMIPK
jgi:hypothetical protein